MDDILKSCPFCGGKASIKIAESLSTRGMKDFYYINCYEKLCQGRNSTTTDKKFLIENWNIRN